MSHSDCSWRKHSIDFSSDEFANRRSNYVGGTCIQNVPHTERSSSSRYKTPSVVEECQPKWFFNRAN